MSQPLPGAALDQLFRTARTYNAFTGEVSDETLHQLYELLKFGPTEANTTPARIVFVKSAEAKAKLGPALSEGNFKKTMEAPVVAIVGYDMRFFDKLPVLFPHTDAKPWFEHRDEADLAWVAMRSSALAGPGLRPDDRLRQCQGRRSLLRRHADPLQHPGQPRPRRPRQHLPAFPAPGLRRSLPHRLIRHPFLLPAHSGVIA